MSQLTPEQLKQLEQLKGIQLPEPISWWPIAIGWWILIALGVIVFITLIVYWWRKRTSLKRAGLTELNIIRENAKQGDSINLATELSVLLKRIVIKTDGESVANLSGSAWSECLERKHMPTNVANFIASAPYINYSTDNIGNEDISSKALLSNVKKWIRRNAR